MSAYVTNIGTRNISMLTTPARAIPPSQTKAAMAIRPIALVDMNAAIARAPMELKKTKTTEGNTSVTMKLE